MLRGDRGLQVPWSRRKVAVTGLGGGADGDPGSKGFRRSKGRTWEWLG